MSWAHVGTVILAAFLASLVEFVEALTIVFAVGTTRGWRSALIGAGAGALFLTVLTLAVGPALQRIPLTSLQLVVGALLLLFGMRGIARHPRGPRAAPAGRARAGEHAQVRRGRSALRVRGLLGRRGAGVAMAG